MAISPSYFSAFRGGNELLQAALDKGLPERHRTLADNTYQVWYLIYNQQNQESNEDREQLMYGLSQIYLGV